MNRRDAIKAAIGGAAACVLPAACQPITEHIHAMPLGRRARKLFAANSKWMVTFRMSDGTTYFGESSKRNAGEAIEQFRPVLGLSREELGVMYVRLRG